MPTNKLYPVNMGNKIDIYVFNYKVYMQEM